VFQYFLLFDLKHSMMWACYLMVSYLPKVSYSGTQIRLLALQACKINCGLAQFIQKRSDGES